LAGSGEVPETNAEVQSVVSNNFLGKIFVDTQSKVLMVLGESYRSFDEYAYNTTVAIDDENKESSLAAVSKLEEFSNGTKAEAMVSSASARGDLATESASTADSNQAKQETC
jgi:hypothetical protein